MVEAPVALFALEWSLAAVDPQVYFEATRPRETSAAPEDNTAATRNNNGHNLSSATLELSS